MINITIVILHCILEHKCMSIAYRLSSEESGNISSLKEMPKTEDFISFLCLRG